MDPTTQRLMMGAAGSGGEKLYIEDVFSTWLYTGNGSTQTITNGIDLAGKGGLVWIKQRSSVADHFLFDTARGARNHVNSNNTGAQEAAVGNTDLYQYNSDGFTLGANYWGGVNTSSETFTSWTFRKAAKFFDVVTYTGNATNNRQIAHNLGSVPGCIIVKSTSFSWNWSVYHRSLATGQILNLDLTAAAYSSSEFESTTPSSTTFTVGNTLGTNSNGETYVAYLFAHDAGGFGDSGNESVVKCGSFTGTGPVGGEFESLSWEPQWLLIKRVDSTSDWEIYDSMRGFVNSGQINTANDARLRANLSNAEDSSYLGWPTATGFQYDRSGTYIYIAIRRGPMKTPTDATKVFEAAVYTGNASNPRTVGTLSVTDLAVNMTRSTSGDVPLWIDRLRGGERYLDSSATTAEAGGLTGWKLEQTGQIINSIRNTSATTYVDWLFRRAPGFFDVVAYTGTGVARTVSHNLGVVPELMIVKRRNASGDWWIYSSNVPIPTTSYLNFNSFQVFSGATVVWNATNPTSSAFTVGTYDEVNGSANTFIAYLFATCPGVSKVGSYTGSGTTKQIDCGFTAGARFVMIKRTDSTGDWYVWDTARGIVSGNDPYLLLNSTAAEVTNTDYIDPLNSGFEISSTAPAAINANGGSFIYLAIA